MESYRKTTLDRIKGGKVRVIGTVLGLKEVKKNLKILSIDDGFGEIRVKVYDKDLNFSQGDIVEVFGELREDSKGKYIFSEKIFKRDIYHELYRLIELKEMPEEEVRETRTYKKEEIVEYVVKKLSEGIIRIEELYEKFKGGEELVDNVIEEFKKEGIIFEERPGVFRRL